MDYRVEDVASICGVSVDTVRYYQNRGLLPAPRRQGRVAWYGDDHLERLRRVQELQCKGLSLKTIARLLSGDLDDADGALLDAVSGSAGLGESALIDLEGLAEAANVPVSLIKTAVDLGLLAPKQFGDNRSGFTLEDVEVAKAGRTLLEWGLPATELLALANDYHSAVSVVAIRAVEMFDSHVRSELKQNDSSDVQLVEAFEAILPAATALVSHHFTRLLLTSALEYVEGYPEARDGLPTTQDLLQDHQMGAGL